MLIDAMRLPKGTPSPLAIFFQPLVLQITHNALFKGVLGGVEDEILADIVSEIHEHDVEVCHDDCLDLQITGLGRRAFGYDATAWCIRLKLKKWLGPDESQFIWDPTDCDIDCDAWHWRLTINRPYTYPHERVILAGRLGRSVVPPTKVWTIDPESDYYTHAA